MASLSGPNTITGTAKGEHLNGGAGADTINGMAGDDRINAGSGADLVDGGAGADSVKLDSGDDVAVYVAAENRVGAGSFTDVYDGGSGRDTLRIVLTRAEWLDPAFQADLVAYQRFLAQSGATTGDASNAEFRFTAFDLRVSKFELLQVTVDGVSLDPRDAAVTLAADTATTAENAATVAFDVLANDSVPDLVRTLTFTEASGGTVALVSQDFTDPTSPKAQFVYTAKSGHWDHLAAGESATDSFTYTVTDADGDVSTATVTVTVTGTNDGPVILSGDTAAEAVEANGAGRLTDAGSIAFRDLDLSDAHTVAVGAAAVTTSHGVPVGFVPATGFGTLIATVAEDTADASDEGRIDWSYAVDDAAVQGLAAGETVTQVYTLTLRDAQGATTTQAVTVVLRGTNDGPTIGVADLSGGVGEREDGAVDENAGELTDAGVIAFGDVDLSDTHEVRASLVSATDSATGAATPARGVFTPALADAATGDAAGEIRWSYAVAAGALDDLAAGQTLTQVYAVTLTDSAGVAVSREVVVVLTGTNDAPTITSAAQSGLVTEVEDLTAGENTAVHTRAGAVTFADADGIDVHSTRFEASGTGYLGTFSLGPVDQSGDGVGWSFSVDDAALDGLADGETRTQAYVVSVEDGRGGVAQQTVTITLTGANDAPTITSAVQSGAISEVADGAAGEDAATHARTGAVTFADVDSVDVHAASIRPGGSDYLGDFSLSPVDQDGDAVAWRFEVTDSALAFLAAGQTRTQSYDVSIDDGRGGVAVQTVAVVLTGANDAPIITSSVQAGAITEAAATAGGVAVQQASGAVTFTDVDAADTHAASFAPGADGYLGVFSLAATDQAGDSVGWSFQVADGALDGLKAGEQRTQTYVVSVGDGQGGTAAQTVTIVLTGTNDAPTITSASQVGAITEVADLAAGENSVSHARSGAVTFADLDRLDAHTATATPEGEGYLGAFTLAPVDGSAVGWSFSVDDTALDFLKAGETRTQSYVVAVSDGEGGVAEQTVTVTLTGSNDAPIVIADTGDVDEDGASRTGAVLANDTDADAGDTLQVVSVRLDPDGGLERSADAGAELRGRFGDLTLNADGTYTYQLDNALPAVQALAAGSGAAEQFLYTARDGAGALVEGRLTISVDGVNDVPVAMADAATTAEDTAVFIDVLANDTDVDTGAALSVKAVSATHGTALVQDGKVLFTPEANYSGPATVTYTLTDGTADVAGTATVTVTPVSDAPMLSTRAAAGAEDSAIALSFAVGTTNRTAQLDGVNDKIVIGGPESRFDLTGSFTLEARIRPEGPGSGGGAGGIILNKDVNYELARFADGSIQYAIADASAPGWSWVDTGYDAPLDQWTHLALVFDNAANAVRLYADGVLVSTTPNSFDGLATTDHPLHIGGRPGIDQHFDGQIDDVRVWAGVRTPAEIAASAAGELAPAASLLGAWSFDTASGPTVPDLSGGGASAGLVNGVILAAPGELSNILATLVDTDGSETMTVTLSGVPAGVLLANADGPLTLTDGAVTLTPAQLAGLTVTPPPNSTADIVLTVTATTRDGSAAPASTSTTLTIDVGAVNDAPVAVDDTTTTAEDTAVLIDVLANDTDVDGPAKSILAVSATNGTATVVDGQVRFTPSVNYVGPATVTYTVTDGTASDVGQVTVTVTPVNDAPTLSSGGVVTGAVTEAANNSAAETGNVTHTATGGFGFADVDAADVHTLVGVTPAGGGYRGALTAVVDPATKTLNWSYAVSDGALDSLNAGQVVTQTYTVVVRDAAGATVSRDVVITLTGAADNGAPVITGSANDPAAVKEITDGQPDEGATTLTATGTVSFTDGDAGDVHSASFAPATGGYLGAFALTGVDQAGGSVGWTFSVADSVLQSMKEGETRQQSYVITVSDGAGGSVQETVRIDLTGSNDAPTVAVAIADRGTNEDAAFTFVVPTNTFADLDGDSLTYSATLANGDALPAWLSFNATTRTFSGTPANADVGPYDVVVKATDPLGLSASEPFRLTVNNTNDAPTALTLSDLTAPENVPGATIGLLGTADQDAADTHIYSIQPGGDGSKFVIVGNELRVGPTGLDYESAPTATINLRVTDSGGLAFNRTVTVSVLDSEEVALTTGLDTVLPANADSQIIGNALTLNATDQLNAGGGADALLLYGAGTYDLRPASLQFAGFETVRLINFSSSTATLHLKGGVDPLTVIGSGSGAEHVVLNTGATNGLVTVTTSDGGDTIDARTASASNLNSGNGNDVLYLGSGAAVVETAGGFDTIYTGSGTATVNAGLLNDTIYLGTGAVTLNAGGDQDQIYAFYNTGINPGGWNSANSIDGGGGSDTLYFYGNVDLTTAAITNVETLYFYGGGSNKISALNLAQVTSLNGNGATLTTDESVLDLTGKSVNAIQLFSGAAGGTTFKVSSQAAALQIVGGAGQDTLQVVGLALAADVRAGILATTSIETIIDTSGTYVAPPADPSVFKLTAGADTLPATPDSVTVNTTALNLNNTDVLNGGATGHDVLALYGGGTFNLNSVSQLSGFEEIQLINLGTTTASLTLRASAAPITVTGTGTGPENIYLNGASSNGLVTIDSGAGSDFIDARTGSAVTLNSGLGNDTLVLGSGTAAADSGGGSDLVNTGSGAATVNTGAQNDTIYIGTGVVTLDAGSENDTIYTHAGYYNSGGWNNANSVNGGTGFDTLYFYGNVDLTAATITNVESLYFFGSGKNVIETASLSGATTISGSAASTLVTSAALLDLTGKTVSGVQVTSSAAGGTTFKVGNLTTALHVIGGAGADTLDATGLTLSAAVRDAMLLGGSIETVIDNSGTYTAPVATPAMFRLTPGVDTMPSSPDSITVYATTASLQSTDVLNGGATGTDVLSLYGGGAFNLNSLAQFSGFERIELVNNGSAAAELRLKASASPTTIVGTGPGAENIYLDGGAANGLVAITSGDGGDFIYALTGSAMNLSSGLGNDQVALGTGAAIIDAGGGSDTLWAGSGTATVNTGAQNDTVYLGTGAVTLNTGSENDQIYGSYNAGYNSGGWNAVNNIDGGAGHDNLYLYSNVDLTTATIANVESIQFYGGGSNKVSAANLANVTNISGHSTSTLTTADSAVDLVGKFVSSVQIFSTAPVGTAFKVSNYSTALQIIGGPGADSIEAVGFSFTADQRAIIQNGSAIEVLIDASGTYGNNAANVLTARAAGGAMYGNGGNDTLISGAGVDALYGGGGSDIFVFAAGGGKDVVHDFQAGAAVGDAIDLSSFDGVFDDFADVLAAAQDVNGNLVITVDANTTITLVGVTEAALNSNDFLF